MFNKEGIMKVLVEDVHTLWKLHSEQRKLEKPSLVLLLQLNDLHL